jgi:hypothetical protein
MVDEKRDEWAEESWYCSAGGAVTTIDAREWNGVAFYIAKGDKSRALTGKERLLLGKLKVFTVGGQITRGQNRELKDLLRRLSWTGVRVLGTMDALKKLADQQKTARG